MNKCQLFVTSAMVVSSLISAAQEQNLPIGLKARSPKAVASYAKLPLTFEANRGQSDPKVRFLSRQPGYSLFLTDREAVLALSRPEAAAQPQGARELPPTAKRTSHTEKVDVVRMQLGGANHAPRVTGEEELAGKTNYIMGSNPADWHSNVPTYAKVKYSQVYPGIDLVYYGSRRQLEYDFVVAPRADPKQVRLCFAGANKLKLQDNGDLTVTAKEGAITFHKPTVYQDSHDGRRMIPGKFTLLAGNTAGFELAEYDHSQELVIDPVLVYSTYFGGDAITYPGAIAEDQDGNVYITGVATSPGFPLTPYARKKYYDLLHGDTFVSKLNAAGTALIYSTYLTANPDPQEFPNIDASAIAVDIAGNAYIGGYIGPRKLPATEGAFQTMDKCTTATKSTNCLTGFVAKLDASGSHLVYATYLGGSGDSVNTGVYPQDRVDHIVVDRYGDAYISGTTYSTDFPVTPGAYETTCSETACYGSFVAKVNPDGTGLIYSTRFNYGAEQGLAVDHHGAAYITGFTSSTDFPTTPGAFQTNVNGGAFVAKFDPTGSYLAYATLLGVTHGGVDYYTEGNAIAVDHDGHAFVVGRVKAGSYGFPTTPGAFQPTLPCSVDPCFAGFVTKLNAEGSALLYSTYLSGPSGGSSISDLALDSTGAAYVVGFTTLNCGFPVTPDALYPTINNTACDALFLSKLSPRGGRLLYSTFLNSSTLLNPNIPSYISSPKVSLDPMGNPYIFDGISLEYGGQYPVTPGAYQTQPDFQASPFVTKFAFIGATTTSIAADVNPQEAGKPVSFTGRVTAIDAGEPPSGDVTVIIDGTVVATKVSCSGGEVSYTISSLSPRTHTVVFSYQGSSAEDSTSYAASNGVMTETVTAPPASLSRNGAQ
jgi:hypothetical protein